MGGQLIELSSLLGNFAQHQGAWSNSSSNSSHVPMCTILVLWPKWLSALAFN